MYRILVIVFVSWFLSYFSATVVWAEVSHATWTQTSELPSGDIFPESPVMEAVTDTEIMLVGIGKYAFFYDSVSNIWHKEQRFHSSVEYANPTAVTLQDGNILVTGMMGYEGYSEVTSQLFNTSTREWALPPPFDIHSRYRHTTTLLDDGTVLLAGGFGGIGGHHLGDVNLYDPFDNMWHKLTYMHQPRSYHTAVKLHDGNVLVVGGMGNAYLDSIIDYTRSTSITSVEKYSVRSGNWDNMSPLLQPRSGHTATVLKNGNVLVTGGLLLQKANNIKKNIATNTAELYDPTTDTWKYVESMHGERAFHTATLLSDGDVLVVGGMNGENSFDWDVHTLASAEIFDVQTNTWHKIPDLRQARGKHAAVLLRDGRVLIAGGEINSINDSHSYSVVNSAELLSFDADSSPQSISPFLRLPFDFENMDLQFEQVAFNPSAWFDHAYPLQDRPCCLQRVTKYNYNGSDAHDYYRSHSGYDYALQNGVRLGTAVLSAGNGTAIFVPSSKSGGGGNVIKIDHKNGYQTWYEHLDNTGLIVSSEGKSVAVHAGQQIGKVGMTGNTNGPHIHFSVFNDENNNANFQDDYPFGFVDPLGWEGKDNDGNSVSDPWEVYEVNGRHGAKSESLFINAPMPVDISVPDSGKLFTLHNNIDINVPSEAHPSFFAIQANVSAYESDGDLQSAMPSFFLHAKDSVGTTLHNFFAPIKILYKYAEADISNIVENSLKLYLFDESEKEWVPLPSSIDTQQKVVSATTTHFSHFALMGKIKDTQAPRTEITLNGTEGDAHWFRSDVKVTVLPTDADGLGIDYTFYSINSGDMMLYSQPFVLQDEGTYEIIYYSIDKADNREKQKTITFKIDKTSPEAEIHFDEDENTVIIDGIDTMGAVQVRQSKIDDKVRFYTKDQAGNSLEMKSTLVGKEARITFSIDSLKYNSATELVMKKNSFTTSHKQSKDVTIEKIVQRFTIIDDEKLQIIFLSPENTTNTIRKEFGEKKADEITEGKHLLQILTDKGSIQFSQ